MADNARGAIIQFEIDRKRFGNKDTFQQGNSSTETPEGRLYGMAKTAACDTIYRGGTFVLVVTADKITMVQRPDAEDL